MATRSARADEQVPLVLDYSAPPGCPGADRFLGDVAARTSLLRQARPDEPAITLTVVIEEIAGGDRGTLKLESTDGTLSARRVSAADCEQVVSALALMTALALDPNASTAPVPTAPAPSPSSSVTTPPAPRAPRPRPPVAVPAQRSAVRWRFQMGVAIEALTGVGPDALFLVRPSLELERSMGSAWSQAFRLSGGLGRGSLSTPAGGADFDLMVGRIEACPARFRPAASLPISPCLALDAGRLQVAGTGVAAAQRVTPPWVAPGAILRLGWEITGALVAEVSGELLFPVTRDRFFVNADTTLHRTPAVVAGVTAGLGGRFP